MAIISISFFVVCFMNYKEKIIEPMQVNIMIKESQNAIGEHEIVNSIDDIMGNSYLECAIHNYNQTTEKIKLLNKSYVLLLISIVVMLFVFLFDVCR